MNWRVIKALIVKYIFTCSRNNFRVMDIFFWPVMDLILWGFVTIYMLKVSNAVPTMITFFISAIILWNILYRAQQVVSVSFLDDVWSRNLLNIFAAPISAVEYVGASYLVGLVQSLVVLILLGTLSYYLHSLNILTMGLALGLLFGNLILMGWSIGLMTTSCILRWGTNAAALAWAVPGLLQPLSAVFYPVSVLPAWVQPFAYCLPASHVFEGMRQILAGGGVNINHIVSAFLLNIVYMAVAAWLFKFCLDGARMRGALVKYGT